MDLKHKNKKNPARNATQSDAGGPGEIALGSHFMKRKNISQGRNTKALLMVLFLVFSFVIFASNINSSKALADKEACELNGVKGTWDAAQGKCTGLFGPTLPVLNPNDRSPQGTSTVVPGQNVKDVLPTDYKVPFDDGNIFTKAIKFLLVGILNLVGWLFAIATTLFAWVVDPANVSGSNGMLNKQAVKDVWIMVRDLLNMTFILILLFAAFCTIFQVDKWNLKKVWLNILINALLVNFSYPIARFIIDISNVAFYYFLNNLFSPNGSTAVTGNSIFAGFGGASNIGNLLMPQNYAQYDIAYLVAIIIVTFIMGMTLMIIAALFVVRLVALTMLVMFSPIGFVGYIFPATSKHADSWWNNLFSYSFFAPIMIFIMAIALRITEALGKENINTFKANAQANANAADANWISQAAFFVIPIIILWVGMGVAKKFGIEGADTVVNGVKKGGKWLANAPGHYSGVYGATKKVKEEFDKKGKLFGAKIPLMGNENRLAREARWSGGITEGRSGYNDTKRDQLRKEVSEMRESWKKAGGASNSELDHALNGSQAEKMAAAMEMSEKNGFKLNETDSATDVLNRYQNAAKAIASDKVMQNNFNDKVKEKHVKLIIKDEITTNTDPTITKNDIYKKHLDKLNASKFAGQKGLADEPEAANYLNDKSATGRNGRKFVDNVAKDLSNEDRKKYKDNGAII